VATADQRSSIPTSRTVLCVVYGGIALIGLIATWSQNFAYFDHFAQFPVDFMNDSKATPASRSQSIDLVLVSLAVVFLMVVEARKHGVKFVWLYVVGAFAIAISVAFPLFLIARELSMGTSDAPSIRTTDKVLLAVLIVFAVGQTVSTVFR
jgi:Terpene cyclase DEP1